MKITQCAWMLGAAIIAANVFAVDDAAVAVKWGYVGRTGPLRWGQLSPSFAMCANGKLQSPINIPNKVSTASNTLSINYHSAPMEIVDNGITKIMIGNKQTIINTGHGIQLNFSPESKESITFNGKHYRLVQFHLHAPSENKLRGSTYPLEIHFVHQSDDGQLAVIGVFARTGKIDPSLQKIVDNLPAEEGKIQTIQGESIDPMSLLPTQRDYYSFTGSLTTPPCTEGVQWIMMPDTITASFTQIIKLKHAMGGTNARPEQPLNGRQVSYAKS